MTSRPIAFTAEMVRAVLAGKKTQTRRLVRSAHVEDADTWAYDIRRGLWESGVYGDGGALAHGEYVRCPYGSPGDRLAVSSYMPDAPRLTLEVSSVRVERLQEIGEDDALAEGITGPHEWAGYRAFLVPGDSNPRHNSAVAAFEALWDSMYAERAPWFEALWSSISYLRAPWSSNPWVWVVGFKRVSP